MLVEALVGSYIGVNIVVRTLFLLERCAGGGSTGHTVEDELVVHEGRVYTYT